MQGASNDTIIGGTDADAAFGGAPGAGRLAGGTGNDSIDGADHASRIDGGAGDDHFLAGPAMII